MTNTWNLKNLYIDPEKVFTELKGLLEKPGDLIPSLKEIDLLYKELESYILCLCSEDTQNARALKWHAELSTLGGLLANLYTKLDNELKDQDGFTSYFLEHRASLAKQKLSSKEEEIINALSVDGYHGYSVIYEYLKNKIRITSLDQKELSYPEAENCLSSINREERAHTHHHLNAAFEKESSLFAETLNHISGFRLEMYKKRGWNTLFEPLHLNHMQEETLHTMLLAIEEAMPSVQEGLKTQASALHIPQLAWYDLNAPICKEESHYSYEKGCQMILEAFSQFAPQLTQFAKKAIDDHWIDAESRKHKRAGGFCTSFPRSKQTRIFMNYQGTFDNVETLAHELGHAFHAHVLFNEDPFEQHYPMSVAEMASTMAEAMLLSHYSPTGKKFAQQSSYLMNLPARFYFETTFYEERKKGFVEKERLSELMVAAQKKAFGNSLSEYCPLFWASKMHFYFTDVPFYNFPYTFGYMFSQGAFKILSQDMPSFEKNYIALLKDTGKMSVENLAKKHLGTDLKDGKLFKMVL